MAVLVVCALCLSACCAIEDSSAINIDAGQPPTSDAIERAVIMCDGSSLGSEDFILSADRRASGGDVDFDSYNLDDIEKAIINKVMKQNQGNVTQAASQLGLTRTSLYRRMEKHGL